jgi:hypothetical protein
MGGAPVNKPLAKEPLPFPTEADKLERDEAINKLHQRMSMIAAYADIVQRHIDIWDIEGAMRAYDRLRGHMVDCSNLRKKI